MEAIGGDVVATCIEDSGSYGIFLGRDITIDSSVVTVSGKTGAFNSIEGFDDSGIKVTASETYNDANPAGALKYVYDREQYYGEYLVNGATAKTVCTVLHYEAKINETKYTTVQRAVDAAQKGDTVVILMDVIVSEVIRIQKDQDLTLDLNGYALVFDYAHRTIAFNASAPAIIYNQGKLVIKDSGTGTNVYYIAKTPDGTGFLVDTADPNFNATTMKYSSTFDYFDEPEEVDVVRVTGGVLAGCSGEAVKNEGMLILESGTITMNGFGVGNYIAYDREAGDPLATFTATAEDVALYAAWADKTREITDITENPEDKPSVKMEMEEGFDPSITLEVKVEVVESKTVDGVELMLDYNELLGKFEKLSCVYNVKLIQDGVEIQPSQIKEGTVITVRI